MITLHIFPRNPNKESAFEIRYVSSRQHCKSIGFQEFSKPETDHGEICGGLSDR